MRKLSEAHFTGLKYGIWEIRGGEGGGGTEIARGREDGGAAIIQINEKARKGGLNALEQLLCSLPVIKEVVVL